MMNLVGIILPALIDSLSVAFSANSSRVRFWISVLVCSAFGAFINLLEHNGFSGYTGMTWMAVAESFSTSILAMFGVAQVVYQAVWKDSGARDRLGMNPDTNGLN